MVPVGVEPLSCGDLADEKVVFSKQRPPCKSCRLARLEEDREDEEQEQDRTEEGSGSVWTSARSYESTATAVATHEFVMPGQVTNMEDDGNCMGTVKKPLATAGSTGSGSMRSNGHFDDDDDDTDWPAMETLARVDAIRQLPSHDSILRRGRDIFWRRTAASRRWALV